MLNLSLWVRTVSVWTPFMGSPPSPGLGLCKTPSFHRVTPPPPHQDWGFVRPQASNSRPVGMGNWCFPGSLNKTQECTHTGLNPKQRPTSNPVIPGKGQSTEPVPRHPWCSSKSVFPAMKCGMYPPLASETWLYHWRIRGTYVCLLAKGPIARTVPGKDLAWARDGSSCPSPPPHHHLWPPGWSALPRVHPQKRLTPKWPGLPLLLVPRPDLLL